MPATSAGMTDQDDSISSKHGLMPEMPGAGEYHGDPVIVGCFDDFVIAHRAARLDHGGRTSLDRNQEPIREGEERVGSHHRALREGAGRPASVAASAALR